MKHRKTQCLSAVLLAVALFPLPGRGGPAAETDAIFTVTSSSTPTPTPTPTPIPTPTPRLITVSIHFRRSAKIIPLLRGGEAAVIPAQDFEVVDEVPWLTGVDVRRIGYSPADHPEFLRLYLTREGIRKYEEARMGNYGRKMVLVIDDTVRSVTTIERLGIREGHRIDFPGTFSVPELERLQAQIDVRPSPPPTPAPSPTPLKRERFIIR